MKNKILSIFIWIIAIGLFGFAGYYAYSKISVSADSQSADYDLNNDGIINALDLNSLIKAVDDKSENPKFDLNGDSKIDSTDIDALIKNWPQQSLVSEETRE